MRQCYTKEGKAETPLTHPLCVPAGRYELEAPSKLTRVQTSLSTRLRFNTVRFVVSETKTLPRHSYSIIGRPIQSLLSRGAHIQENTMTPLGTLGAAAKLALLIVLLQGVAVQAADIKVL